MAAYLTGLEDEIGVKVKKVKSAVKIREINLQQKYMPYGSVLIVDDIKTNLYVAKNMIEPYGFKIDAASGGIDAIEKISENRNYDVVFMGHLMPEMDGIIAANAI